jgi:hypothetical protein
MKAYYYNPQTGQTKVVDMEHEVAPVGWVFASLVPDPVGSSEWELTNVGTDETPIIRVGVEAIVWQPYFYALLAILGLMMFFKGRR